ncbi:MAG: sigma 54-interacting transcriptional regulator [Geobacteraceae bacterium]|nr:sigma 54-interacting transcriptional regulator [Geobacteraceae bacterium]
MTSYTSGNRILPCDVGAIKAQWERFVKGEPVDHDIIRPIVLSSWKRSRITGVDPFHTFGIKIISREDTEKQKLTRDELLKAFGSVIPIIEEIIIKNQLNLQLFDSNAQSIHLAMFQEFNSGKSYEEVESKMLGNLSEKVIGTNAPCLALSENKPVQIIGAEHYNYYLHDYFCCSAPIHDTKGKTVGALNIFSNLGNYFEGIFGLVSCLASIFDNRALIQTALEELDIYELAANNIMEKSAKGVMYISRERQIKYYNTALVNLLNIPPGQKDKEALDAFLSVSRCLASDEQLENKEVIISTNGRKKSLLVTTQNLVNAKNEPKGKMVFVEDTDAVYKSFQRIRGNKAHYTFEDIIGENRELAAAKDLARKVAGTRAAVLIHGESGTGKELFAQAIHNSSTRKPCPFVSINCGAIPPELIESELFGYEAGAFTGALKGGKPGKLELASGGTLFLDEIESMPLNAQIKLLRALSTHKISRIGSIEEIPIDVRIVSATKTDLLKEADEGNFREDLYYRISTIVIKLPSLRERVDDIPLLTAHLVKLHTKESSLENYQVCPEFIKTLAMLPWRGNVRELSNVLERAIALSDNDHILKTGLLPENDGSGQQNGGLALVTKLETHLKNEFSRGECGDMLKVSEEIAIRLALDMDSGNVAKAAKRLGISKPTLYSKIKQNENLKM